MKLSTKLTFYITIIMLLSISTIVVFVIDKQKDIILGQIQKKGIVLSEVMTMACVNAFLNYDYSTLKRFVDTINKDEDVISITVADNNNIIKMDSNSDKLGEKTKYFHDNNIFVLTDSGSGILMEKNQDNEYIYTINTIIEAEGSELGYVNIVLSSRRANVEARKSRNQMLLIGIIALIINILIIIFLSRRITKPIKKLVMAAENVSEGNLNWDIEIKSKDEIGVLADSFKYMTINLRKYIESRLKNERFIVLGQLSAVVTHEVRNPLEPIKGSAELIKNLYKKDEIIQEYMNVIQEEISELSSFLDSLLNFAKPQALKKEKVEINLIIDDVLLLLNQFFINNGIKIEKLLSTEIPKICVDPYHVKQTFINIMLNAVQAKKGDMGIIKITTVTDKINDADNGKYVIIEILDYGKGIEKESLKDVFDPFFTTRKDGTGLGLSSCLNIIEQHAGKIRIESEAGQWTVVKVFLPMENKEDSISND